MRKVFLTIILTFVISALDLYADEGRRYTIDNISTLNGLPHNDALDIIQDSYGYIWTATSDGLCRYDGYEFKIFSIGDLGLTSNMILSLAEGRRGDIWIGTTDKGLFCYVRSENRIYNYSELSDNPIQDIVSIRRVAVDAKGDVWCYDNNNKRIIRIKFNYATKRVKSTTCFAVPGDATQGVTSLNSTSGRIYISTRSEIYEFSNDKNSFVQIHSEQPLSNIKMVSHRDDLLFVLELNRLLTLDINTGEIKRHQNFAQSQCFCWLNNSLWVAANNGVYSAMYDPFENRFSEFKLIKSYSDVTPLSITKDHANGLWVGIKRLGIDRFEVNNTPFYTNRSLTNNLITAIHRTSKNKILAGSFRGGLYELDRPYSVPKKIGQLSPYSTVMTINEGVDGSLYVSTYNRLYRLWGDNYESMESLIEGMSVWKITVEQEYLWLAIYGGGVIRYNIKTKEQINITHESGGLPSNIVRNVMLDSKSNIWVCTSSGVAKIDAAERFADHPTAKMLTTDDEKNHYTVPIIEDRNGDIWYGTLGYGVYHVKKSGEIINYTKRDGLITNIIYAIEEDKNGDIWISTNRGLSEIVVGENGLHVKNFDIYDGLQNNVYNELSSTKLTNGSLLFGGVSGFTYFNPSYFTQDATKVIPTITDFKIDGKSIFEESHLQEILPSGIVGQQGINLKHNQNNFSLKFAGLHYSTPSKYSYKYHLEGADRDWMSTTTATREINYTNLKPGKYNFYLKVADSDGVWCKEPLIIPINIEYPIWQQWYAIILYALLLLAIGFYIIRYFHEVTQRRNAIKIANLERQKIEEMLEMRTRFFTNVSHEFRTPLTLILSPMQRLMADDRISSNSEWVELLNTMSHNGDSLMRLINKFLSYTKQESGELKAQLCSGDIVALSERLFMQFRFWADRKNIALSFDAPKRGIRVNLDPYLMEQIIYNLVSNALKHTPASGKISMTIEEGESCVIIAIKDSGCGVPKEMQQHIFERYFSRASEASKSVGGTGVGLFLSKKLIELHEGRIWFESEDGVGSTFFVELPRDLSATAEEVTTQEEEEEIFKPSNDLEEEIEPSDVAAQPTLLIVDDNIELLQLLKELFESSYKVLTAQDGQEGLDVASTLMPDIIISDVMMPRMDGLELCERLKNGALTSHIPIILLSAKASNEDVAAGLRATADAYCPKPFNNLVLREMVNTTLINRRKIASRITKIGGDLSTFAEFSESATTNVDKIFLKKLTKYIEDNIDNSELSATEICEHMGLSSFILNKKLKSLLNMTIIVFIRSIRLRRAAELLKNPTNSIADVTYDVGFNDLKYFRRCFKAEFGMLPQEYKSIHCKD